MKVKDIPEYITGSDTLGELVNLKCIYVLVEELTENPFKDNIQGLIDKRTEELMNMDV